jgi:hypothetical protein
MHTTVSTTEQQQQFNQIWEQCWKEEGFEFEYSENAEQFLFLQKESPVGCVEIKPYNPTIDATFPFSQAKSLKNALDKTYEIDKLSILKACRGKGMLEQILNFLVDFSIEKDVSYFVALMNPKLYWSLKVLYRLPIQKAGHSFHYKGDKVVPIILNVRQASKQLDRYTWLKKAVPVSN